MLILFLREIQHGPKRGPQLSGIVNARDIEKALKWSMCSKESIVDWNGYGTKGKINIYKITPLGLAFLKGECFFKVPSITGVSNKRGRPAGRCEQLVWNI